LRVNNFLKILILLIIYYISCSNLNMNYLCWCTDSPNYHKVTLGHFSSKDDDNGLDDHDNKLINEDFLIFCVWFCADKFYSEVVLNKPCCSIGFSLLLTFLFFSLFILLYSEITVLRLPSHTLIVY